MVPGAVGLELPAETLERARRIVEEGTAPATRRARRGDLAYFWSWAAARFGLVEAYPVAPATVMTFLTDHLEGLPEAVDRHLVDAGVKARAGVHAIATVERRLASLSKAHRLQDLDNPCQAPVVSELLSQARRRAARRGERPAKKRALTLDLLEQVLAPLGDELRDVRDRALLLVAWGSGGRRRSEVAALSVADLDSVEDGYLWTVRHGKTDQEGAGLTVPVVGRVGQALSAWLAAAGITEGTVFRAIDRHGNLRDGGLSGKAVATVVKARCAVVGLSAEAFGGHSLRSGFVTEGGRQGRNLADVMAMSGHRSVPIAMSYHQVGAAENNPAARLAD
jgi:integrase